MQPEERVIKCYNTTAANYAIKQVDEIYKTRLDSFLLKDFSSANLSKGLCADFGCGPGATTKFLYDNGLSNIVGVDISPEIIKVAIKLFPEIRFETGNLLNLMYRDNSFASAIAYYSIVHFDYEQVKTALNEVNRVLQNNGQFLLSFHVGNQIVHFDKAENVDIDIDLYYFQTDKIIQLLKDTGFEIIEAIERLPYKNIEFKSIRGYIWAEKKETTNR
ncbi:class I SAM-dependent methyltransferase [Belliella marina]|uniref:Class I SAM-dependent methyltransferase n=1 Tax=Belliella marina TaxID=1644146 RepID=A0ABW4VPC4_9BACT